MDRNSKIFVAGGSGMVGSALLRELTKAGYENIISNYFRKKPITDYKSRITFIPLDLIRQADVMQFFEKERPDYVFLAAAKVGGILANDTYKAEFIFDNIMIASNIIHASYQNGVKKLLNLGSSCIYPKFAPQPLKEEYLLTGLLEPTNEPYAIAKISAIKLCRYYNEQYGTNFISVMPTNLYGINDNFNLQTSHVLPALIRKMHLGKCLEQDDIASIREDLKKYPLNSSGIDHISNGEVIGILSHYGIRHAAFNIQHSSVFTSHSSRVCIELWGSGKPFREFLFVDDLAEACLFLMEQYGASDIGEFVNIGTGSDITISDLAMLTKDIIGFQGDISRDSSKPDGTPRKLLDVSKITSLGWRARTSLAEGIRKTYEWYVSNSNDR